MSKPLTFRFLARSGGAVMCLKVSAMTIYAGEIRKVKNKILITLKMKYLEIEKINSLIFC